VRRARQLSQSNFLNNSKLSIESKIRRAEVLLDQTKLDIDTVVEIDAMRKKSGRPSEISVRAMLVAMIVLAEDGALHLARVVRFLNSLDQPTLIRLGVHRNKPVTRRQVEHLFRVVMRAKKRVAANTGVTKYEVLDAMADKALAASAHKDVKNSASIAIDGTTISSWGTNRRKKVVGKDGYTVIERVSSDPDAKYRGKSEYSWKRPVFGYDLTGAVSIPDLDGDDVPLAMLSMRFRPATTTPTKMALSAAASVAKGNGRLGDVLVDREYTLSVDGKDFLLPIRAMGGEPVFDLTEAQRGARGTVRGAIVVDGHPFSPSLPKDLYNLVVPPVGATSEERRAYQEKVALRAKYALKVVGSPKSDGRQIYMCPAAAGQVKCSLMVPLRPVKRGTLPIFNTPSSVQPGSVCASAHTTFSALDLPLAQRDLYGSYQWFKSYNRRNRVEGFFGNLKNEATENLRPGSIRVRGGLETGFLTMLFVVATNFRLAERWDERTPAKKTAKRRGRPRSQVMPEYLAVALSAGRSNGPPVISGKTDDDPMM
jgi:hypothetical protein